STPAPFAHDRPIAEQARHDLHDIKPVDVSSRIGAGQKRHFSAIRNFRLSFSVAVFHASARARARRVIFSVGSGAVHFDSSVATCFPPATNEPLNVSLNARAASPLPGRWRCDEKSSSSTLTAFASFSHAAASNAALRRAGQGAQPSNCRGE